MARPPKGRTDIIVWFLSREGTQPCCADIFDKFRLFDRVDMRWKRQYGLKFRHHRPHDALEGD
jgi:hypothetical protein